MLSNGLRVLLGETPGLDALDALPPMISDAIPRNDAQGLSQMLGRFVDAGL